MKRTLLTLVALCSFSLSFAQTISIVGSGVNGWPPTNGPEITLATSDNIIYTISNLVVTTGEVKFRQDFDWTINWGTNAFPSGTGTQGGQNIPTQAGTYNVTFNRLNGAYSFVGNTTGATIELWGPAVDAQLGYGGPGIMMTTTDDITYILGNFTFTSGNAYFRQNGNSNLTYGSTSFPTGTAVPSGPSIPIVGREWYVTFNRITGNYSFNYPIIGIVGTAVNGWDSDTDLSTSDGFNYSVVANLSAGELKFRKNHNWGNNWGGNTFPTGTGNQDGANIVIPNAGNFEIAFEALTGNYSFNQQLGNSETAATKISIWPNPSTSSWNFESNASIQQIRIMDSTGKTVILVQPTQTITSISIDASTLEKGIYFAAVEQGNQMQTYKLGKQ